jgi:hypothetical protein
MTFHLHPQQLHQPVALVISSSSSRLKAAAAGKLLLSAGHAAATRVVLQLAPWNLTLAVPAAAATLVVAISAQ